MMNAFNISRLPRILFGPGTVQQLPGLAARYGKHVLLVTGRSAIRDSRIWTELLCGLEAHGMTWEDVKVETEPSPYLVDTEVTRLQDCAIDVVVGIGGGSALDAAKAIAGLLRPGNSVMDHLEGVGPERPYSGPATPFIAVPTTAGTGSEATKNAVLSLHGEHGFKKSFRDESLIAEYAVVDPDLLASCPAPVIAANGMDALTQLLESFVSTKANPFTDALALDGLRITRDSLLVWYRQGASAADARSGMAYAALLSGITLAQVGLGSVHGLAAPLGAFFPIPHGVACGTLVAAATQINIQALKQRTPAGVALRKYAQLGRLLGNDETLDDLAAHDTLIEILDKWTREMDLPRLNHYGVCVDDLSRIVTNSRGSSMKTNPILLTDDEIETVLRMRL
ncbi:iron-containing alcohol dehydrogenase [Sulfuriferula sp. GW1]|uniref:iron-containing alcohol dehydrogenase n=1 Tax=Sulfuriferula sp. GW1 TaxID=3345111 RepID=UPI0039B02800